MDGGINSNITRRNLLKRGVAVVGAVAAGSLVGGKALAQSSKQPQVKSSDDMARDMARAHRDLMEHDRKAKKLREAKPYRDALDAQKKIFKQNGKNNPLYTEYQDALAKKFGITDWVTDEGRKILGYLNDWYNEN
jgi:hypothetical protein